MEQRRAISLPLIAACLACAILFAQGARGDAVQHSSKKRFEAGMALFAAKNYAGAAAEFEASIAILPTKPGLFNLASCYKELKRYREALDVITRLREKFGRDLGVLAESVNKTEQELREILASSPLKEEPVKEPGKASSDNASADPDAGRRLVAQLEEAPQLEQLSVPFWVGMSSALAAAAVAGVLGGVASVKYKHFRSQRDDYYALEFDDESSDYDEMLENRHKAGVLSKVAIGFGIGAAALTMGTLLVLAIDFSDGPSNQALAPYPGGVAIRF